MTWTLWVPGRFDLTNKMLDNLRAAGRGGARPPRGFVDLFAEECRRIRWLTFKAAKEADLARQRSGGRCSLTYVVFGHRRHDPDAWLLLGKAATDGLRDARVFASDRHEVGEVRGYVCQSQRDETEAARDMGKLAPCPGLMVTIAEVPHA